MGFSKSISIFGGQEIIQCKYLELFEQINNFMVNDSNNASLNDIENFFNSKISKHKLTKIHDSLLGIGNEFEYPEMLNISAFTFDEIVLYFPTKQVSDFWFDLISLNYLYRNNFIKASIIMFSPEFIKSSKLEFQQLITLLIDRSLWICGFPSLIIY